MRILVISLLRIGDLLMTAPAIAEIRRRHPQAQVDLVINRGSRTAARLIPDVSEVLIFEREELQAGLCEPERAYFESYDRLQAFVEDLQTRSYDVVYNFTHNRLSAWLSGLVGARKVIGLCLEGTGGASFASPWFRQLNFQVDVDERESFHHVDIFWRAVQGSQVYVEGHAPSLPSGLQETESGRRQAAEFLRQQNLSEYSEAPLIGVQISTSDAKKEWGDDRFIQWITALSGEAASVMPVFLVFGATFEKERIDQFVSRARQVGADARAVIVDLETAYSLMDHLTLLVTGDTAMKHLGSASSAPVLELILGSADAFRTGAWKVGDVVMRSREACAPCGHSEKCHRATHACAESLPVQEVVRATRALLSYFDRELLTPTEAKPTVADRSTLETRAKTSRASQVETSVGKTHAEKTHGETHGMAARVQDAMGLDMERPSPRYRQILQNALHEKVLQQQVLQHQGSQSQNSHAGEVRVTSASAEILIVERLEGISTPIRLGTEFSETEMTRRVERASRRLALELRTGKDYQLRFGTEIRQLRLALDELFAADLHACEEMRHTLPRMERMLQHAEGIVQSLHVQLQALKSQYQDPQKLGEMVRSILAMRRLLEKQAVTKFAAQALETLTEDDRAQAFVRFRRMVEAVEELRLRVGLQLKLIRGLEAEFNDATQFEEKM
ncbi:MAG TPA: glycosyltransferase family 9 protein [Pseudobdellovibrionaceae bacterium]|nr:glycosyltransferase family 9 protein [Pseudobdellovibrionaceae bacterium]